MRVGDLRRILADLDLRYDRAVRLFSCAELVDTAEDGRALGRDHALADAECVNRCTLTDQREDDLLVERVGGHDLAIDKACVVQHLARLLRQVGNIARVKADSAVFDALRPQHFLEDADGVRHTALQGVVGVHQQGCVGGVKLAVGLEGFVFTVEHLHP